MSAHLPSRIAGTFHANFTLSPRERGEFAKLGVTDEMLDADPPVRAGYISFLDADRFEFEQHRRVTLSLRTVRAYLLLADDIHGEAEDIVAWLPGLDRIATWLGCAWALGAAETYVPRLSEHNALPVFRDIPTWLRERRRGLVILKPRIAAGWLTDAGPLLAQDRSHGLELKAALTRQAPRIIVNTDTARRAA